MGEFRWMSAACIKTASLFPEDHFRERAYGSLEDFSKQFPRPKGSDRVKPSDWGTRDGADKDSIGACALVMTYAPLEGEAAAEDLKSVGGGAWGVRHVMIHELSQVTGPIHCNRFVIG